MFGQADWFYADNLKEFSEVISHFSTPNSASNFDAVISPKREVP